MCGRPAGWRVLADRADWLKVAAARFRCRPGRGHIMAAARLQLVVCVSLTVVLLNVHYINAVNDDADDDSDLVEHSASQLLERGIDCHPTSDSCVRRSHSGAISRHFYSLFLTELRIR